MNIIFGEDKGYSTLDNGELLELNQTKENIQEIINTLGNYKIKQTLIVKDPDMPNQKNLIVVAKDENGKPTFIAFEKYGVKYVKLNNRKVAQNQLQSKNQYLDLSAVFTAKMIKVNGEKYKNSALARFSNTIDYLERKIALLLKTQPTSEQERLNIESDIAKYEKIIKAHKYTFNKINEILSTEESCSEK